MGRRSPMKGLTRQHRTVLGALVHCGDGNHRWNNWRCTVCWEPMDLGACLDYNWSLMGLIYWAPRRDIVYPYLRTMRQYSVPKWLRRELAEHLEAEGAQFDYDN